MVAMCVDGREGSWRDTFERREGDRSTFEADGQPVKKADARRVPAGGSEAKAVSSLVGFGATAGQPLAQQQNFLANGAMEPGALRAASTERFSGRRPRLAARLVVALSSRKTRCDGWGAMVGTLQRPEERTPAPAQGSHSPSGPRLPSVPSHYAALPLAGLSALRPPQ